MASHYSPSELKDIGKQSRTKLPPASAVQAMFMYEMQRETEVESLFQGQMFRLARAEDESVSQERRIRELGQQVQALKEKVTANDAEARLSTSKVRMDILQKELDLHAERLDNQGERLVLVDHLVDLLDSKERPSGDMGTGDVADKASHSSELGTIRAQLETANEDISVLFDERDALVTLLNQANERINKLEGLIRALTLQNPSSGSNPSSANVSPPIVQFLPVQTANGQQVELSVPKGKGLAPHLKANRVPIKTFTPGKQWQS